MALTKATHRQFYYSDDTKGLFLPAFGPLQGTG